LCTQQCGILGRWLDMNATPAVFVKELADRVDPGVMRPDIDVEAGTDMTKRTPQKDILEILGVACQGQD
jgi:hypothetical protein